MKKLAVVMLLSAFALGLTPAGVWAAKLTGGETAVIAAGAVVAAGVGNAAIRYHLLKKEALAEVEGSKVTPGSASSQVSTEGLSLSIPAEGGGGGSAAIGADEMSAAAAAFHAPVRLGGAAAEPGEIDYGVEGRTLAEEALAGVGV